METAGVSTSIAAVETNITPEAASLPTTTDPATQTVPNNTSISVQQVPVTEVPQSDAPASIQAEAPLPTAGEAMPDPNAAIVQTPVVPPPATTNNSDIWATMALQVQGNLREWKRFTSFVDLQRRIGKLPPSEHYLSTGNIELYVQMVQMGANPGTPTIPSNLPPTFGQLLEEHLEHGLENFRLGKKTHWQRNQRIAYSNRSYLYDCIAKRAVSISTEGLEGGENCSETEKLKAAAKAMDEDRGDKTVAAYMKDLKAADKTIVRRKRKEKSTPTKDTEDAEKAKKRGTAATQQDTFKVEGNGNAANIETAVPNEMLTLDGNTLANASSETPSVNKLEVLENAVNI